MQGKNFIRLGFWMIMSGLFLPSLDAQISQTGNAAAGKTYAPLSYGIRNNLMLRESDLQLQMSNFEEAYFALESAVAQNPLSAEVLIRRAAFKKRFGMVQEAEADLRLAQKINPYAADLYGYNGPLSVMNVMAYQPEKALRPIGVYQQMDDYYPILDEQFSKEAIGTLEFDLLEEAIVKIEAGELPEALETLDALLALAPETAIGYDMRGMIFTKLGRYDEAEVALARAVSLQPSFAIAWYNFSRLERARNNQQQARVYLDRAIQLQDDLTKAYFERASLHKAMGDKEAALADYDKVIKLRGEDYLEAYLNRGLTRKMLGDFNGALADLNKAIEEYPSSAELYNNRANVYLLYGDHTWAVEDYTKAIQLNPNYAEAYYNRALVHLLAYDKISACHDLTQSAALGYDRAQEKLNYFCGD